MRLTRSFCFSLIQGLDGGGPAMLPPRIRRAENRKFGLTPPTVAPSPNFKEALRFVSTALHSLPTVEVRTGRFSEGIFATSEEVYL
jgi:hypothetical protein